MNNALYDKLKFVAQVGLPAVGTLYFSLAGVWNLPSAEEVVATIVAVDTFLGVVLQISSKSYKDGSAQGTLEVFENADKTGKTFALKLDGDPEYELEGKDRVVFRVNHEQEELNA